MNLVQLQTLLTGMPMRFTTLFTSKRSWPLLVIAVTVFSLLMAFAPGLQAAPAQPSLAQQQLFNSDLTVRNGETIEGDVAVYQGDVTVARGGAIRGNLVVYSGDVEIDAGGLVAGDITAFSGSVEVDGAVNGAITAWSGDVKLGRSAVVGGDVSVVSGEIKQERGAVVEGSLLRGPAVSMPALPPIGALSGAPVAPAAPAPATPIESFWWALGRVFTALFVLGISVLVAILLLKWRPAFMEEMRGLLVERAALAFAAGLIFNMFALALIGLLWLTFCFRPPALLLGVLLVAVNLVGFAIVGDELGRRFAVRLGAVWPQLWRAAVGVVAPGAVIAFLWILGSCFGFLAFLGALVLSAFGAGTLLIKVLKLGESSPSAAAPVAAATPVTAEATEATTASATVSPVVEPPVAERAPETVTPQAVAPEPEVGDLVTASPVLTTPASSGEDDFTRINGIGPVFEQRLKAAGIRTFAELAARTPAEIAEIVKWPVARVERAAIVEQALRLAKGDV